MRVVVDGVLTNVDHVLLRAWHPIARSDEVGAAPVQSMLVGRLWTLRRVSGRVVADPCPYALRERWGLVWLAPRSPVVELFDDPDEADARDVGAWLTPVRTPVPAGAVADSFLAAAGPGEAPGYQVRDEPYGFRGVQVGPQRRVMYVYRAPFQLLLRRDELDTGASRTLLCFVQPEQLTSSRVFTKLLLRAEDGVPRPSPAVLAQEVATHQAALADGLAYPSLRPAADGLSVALRRVLHHLGGLDRG
jgi:hypothetical protein